MERTGPGWLEQKERGSATLMAVIVSVALTLGRPVAALLLYPICAYFLLFSVAARQASQAYLARVFHRAPRLHEVFAHYHCFAATILDRVFLHTGRLSAFRFDWVGLDVLQRVSASKRGCLLLGAHYGSFEALRALAVMHGSLRLRVLMHATHAAKMNSVLHSLAAKAQSQVIPLGRPQTMLEVRAALAAGEVVALLADRALTDDRRIDCDFLGSPAVFPSGPFELAAMLGAPVVLFCATYRGHQRYEIRFEALDACVDGSSRSAGVDARCRAFAEWLAARCRAAPYNWFNFYDFWARDARGLAK